MSPNADRTCISDVTGTNLANLVVKWGSSPKPTLRSTNSFKCKTSIIELAQNQRHRWTADRLFKQASRQACWQGYCVTVIKSLPMSEMMTNKSLSSSVFRRDISNSSRTRKSRLRARSARNHVLNWNEPNKEFRICKVNRAKSGLLYLCVNVKI